MAGKAACGRLFYDYHFIIHGRNHAFWGWSHMRTKAAVAFGAGRPLEICDVDLEGPRAGEVLVEMKASGSCLTDAFTLSGDDPEG